MGTRDAFSPRACGPRASGIHIRQIPRAHVTTITYSMDGFVTVICKHTTGYKIKVYSFTFHTHLILFLIAYTGKFWLGKKLANLANRELFAKIFPTNIHRYTQNVFGIYTDCSLFTKFFLANSFICMVRQNFPVYCTNVCSLDDNYLDWMITTRK